MPYPKTFPSIGNNSAFATEFVHQAIISKGFGTLNKSDYESLLVFLLNKYDSSFSAQSTFQKSLLLKQPESKIRRLEYEGALKYGQHDIDAMRVRVKDYLENRECAFKENFVSFNIEDKFLYDFVSAYIKDQKHYVETSFNKDTITLSRATFSLFIEDFLITAPQAAQVKAKGGKTNLKSVIGNVLAQVTSTAGNVIIGEIVREIIQHL